MGDYFAVLAGDRIEIVKRKPGGTPVTGVIESTWLSWALFVVCDCECLEQETRFHGHYS